VYLSKLSQCLLLSLTGMVGVMACQTEAASVAAPTPSPEPATAAPAAVPVSGERSKFMVRAEPDNAPLTPEPVRECPQGMVLVSGRYCPEVRQQCLRYMDPKGRYEQFRCAEYAPSECLSKERREMRFCIDRDEYTAPGENLPANFKSFTHAEKACAASGKRVCQESEWVFACEGEEMSPYPYGHQRDPSACNADRTDIVGPGGELRDLRAPADAFPRCQSPFGVRNLAGNLEEFVALDGPGPKRPAMKGAYWQPSRNFCRAKQTAHDRYYNGTETGFRCCADATRAPQAGRVPESAPPTRALDESRP
jgi:formylglycine-generating enzyme